MTDKNNSKIAAAMRNSILVVGSLFVTLLVAELGARVLISDAEREKLPIPFVSEDVLSRLEWQEKHRSGVTENRYGFDAPDPKLGWRLRPGISVASRKVDSYDVTITSNADGIRSQKDYPHVRPENRFRIGFFGDSLTFGEGVNDNETYSAMIENSLVGVDALNFAVHGYGTDQMYLRYVEDGTKFELDVVVLAFASFHMFRNNTSFGFFAKPKFELDSDNDLVLTGVPVPDPVFLIENPLQRQGSILDNSVIAAWIWQRVMNINDRRVLSTDSDQWKLTAKVIEEFAGLSAHHDAKFLIVDLSSRDPMISSELEALASEIAADHLSVKSRFDAAAERGETFRLQNDGHWNEYGHSIVANMIADHVCTHYLTGTCAQP